MGVASVRKMVGTIGFEPTTSPTPRVRDTRLRYVPTDTMRSGLYSFIRLSLAFDERQETAQTIPQVQQHLAAKEFPRAVRRSRASTRATTCAIVALAGSRAFAIQDRKSDV